MNSGWDQFWDRPVTYVAGTGLVIMLILIGLAL
jgi:hypothetical protein